MFLVKTTRQKTLSEVPRERKAVQNTHLRDFYKQHLIERLRRCRLPEPSVYGIMEDLVSRLSK